MTSTRNLRHDGQHGVELIGVLFLEFPIMAELLPSGAGSRHAKGSTGLGINDLLHAAVDGVHVMVMTRAEALCPIAATPYRLRPLMPLRLTARPARIG